MHAENIRTVRDIEGDELGTWILNNHGGYYSSHSAFMLSFIVAKEFYSHESGYARASIERLLKDLGASTRAVKRWIASMREVRDENGKPLWEVERGIDSRNGKVVAHRYYPLFLKDILEASQPVAKRTPTKPNADISFKSVADARASHAGKQLRASLEADEAHRVARVEELFNSYMADQPRDLPLRERTAVALHKAEEELVDPFDGFDTHFFPKTLLELERWLEQNDVARIASIKYDGASGLSPEQRYVAGSILTGCASVRSLNPIGAARLEKFLVDTWLAHPDTDPCYFYRRFMHSYESEINERWFYPVASV